MTSKHTNPLLDSAPDTQSEGSTSIAQEHLAADVSAGSDRDEEAAFGAKLRSAREALGLSLEDAGRKLHLPARVLRQLEADDLDGIDSPLYLHGYLRSYTKLLGIDLAAVPAASETFEVRPVPLETTGGMSQSRFLLQRYVVASTYLVITALIVVPIIVLGLNGGLTRDVARVAPLAVTPATGSSAEDLSFVPADMPDNQQQTAITTERPLMASMAPFSLLDTSASDSQSLPVTGSDENSASATNAEPHDTKPIGATDVAASDNVHRLRISLTSPSWVEVTDAAGTRLEYALLTTGEFHYSSELALSVLLGDSTAAEVAVDGKTVDLAAYRHGNLASFRVDGKSGIVTAPDDA